MHLMGRDNVIRMPGFFGSELAPPPQADEQTRWLAYLGRFAWRPVTALATIATFGGGPT